jgi:biotin synthase-related radical SAM superfamily protein
MKEMFFQPHRPEENQMKEAYKNYNKVEFVQFIIDNSCLLYSKIIGEENGRTIYKLWR